MPRPPRSQRWITLAATSASCALLITERVIAQNRVNEDNALWSQIAREKAGSPASAEASDHSLQWQGPDGQTIHLVVKEPHPRPNAPSVTLNKIADGADARPAFDAATDLARKSGAGQLIIPPGHYVFRSKGVNGLGQWVLANLHDLTISGAGATLDFTQNADGLYISGSQRLKLSGITIAFTMPLAGIGHVTQHNGQNAVTLDPRWPLPPDRKIGHLSDYDPIRRDWMQGGQRLYFPPGSPNTPQTVDGQTFTSPIFRTLKPDSTLIALYHFYGSPAIEIKDIQGQAESEDIVLDGIAIHGSPGMGVVVTRMKRGFALLNSRITPSQGPSDLVSAEYDAIHTLVNEGDILIANNVISGQGDDGINLNSPVQYVLNVGTDGRTIQIANFSRFYRKGDHLAFFDANGTMIARSMLTAPPKPIGNGNVELSLDPAVPGLMPKMTLRDSDLLPRRFAIIGNTITHCQCHALVAQIPHGLISGNTFSGTDFNAIRLVSNIGQWKEGVGAFNIKVEKNTLEGSGPDKTLAYPFGAISIYGIGSGANISTAAMNDYISITDNTIRNTAQGCISIASASNVTVARNSCVANNQQQAARASVLVMGKARGIVSTNADAP